MTEDKLSSGVLYLPIDLVDRVQLWLTYKGIKPASTIMFPNSSHDLSGKKRRRVERWLENANLKYDFDTQNPRLVHVSNDATKVKTLRDLQWSQKTLDIKKRGLLYGYPRAAVEEFSKAWAEKRLEEKMASKNDINQTLGDSYWKSYFNYSSRKKYISEDSQVAKLWADELRNKVPKLAKWFERGV